MSDALKKVLVFLRHVYPKSIPDEFYQSERKRSQRFLRTLILLIGSIILLFIIPDIIFIKDSATLLRVILLRSIFFAAALVPFLLMKKMQNPRVLSLVVTIYEFLFAALFVSILGAYATPDYMIQSMGVIVIIIGIYLIPNRWSNMLLVTIVFIAGFLTYSYLTYSTLPLRQFWAGAVYIILAALLCAVSALWSLKYRLARFLATRELMEIYSTDPLTKTCNRFKLTEEAEKWIGFCSRHQLPLSLVLIDVDDLKRINDEHGHIVGDSVLIDLGSIITSQIRSMDLCVRWGGDEFVLLLPYTRLQDAITLSERIRFSIINHRFEYTPGVTCCFGAAEWKAGWGLEELIAEADKSMYSAKKTGKNKVHSSPEHPS